MKIFWMTLLWTYNLFSDEYGSMCMSFPQAVLYRISCAWSSVTPLQKVLILALIILTTFWVIWRIIKCGWGGCGCNCKGSCHCTL